MRRPLLTAPVLHAMRTFDAAARHLNFSRAAEELSVSPGAVSQQIKQLEERLGAPLFVRLPRGIALTAAGARLFVAAEGALDSLGSALDGLSADAASGGLDISCAPSFALIWLIPRLGEFNQAYPDIQLRIKAEFQHLDPAQMRRERIDLAIRYDIAPYADFARTELMSEVLLPVASPPYLAERPAEAVDRHAFLHDAMPWASAPPFIEWLDWVEGAAARLPKRPKRPWRQLVAAGTQFNLSQLAMSAAMAGQGIAMGRASLVLDALQQGRLASPWPLPVRAKACYSVLAAPDAAPAPARRCFIDWLVARCGAFAEQRDAWIAGS